MLFIDRPGWLHKLHPFTKLVLLLLSAALAYLTGLSIGSLSLLLAACLLLIISGGIFSVSAKMVIRIFLPLILFMVPIHGLLNPANTTEIFSFHGIVFYREGLFFALKTLMQLGVVISASLAFVFTTHPADLITAVSHASGSISIGYLLGFPLLLLESMRERVVTIQNAQRARGLEIDGNIFRRFTSLGPLLFPLLIGSIVGIEQRSIALEVRGFKIHGPKTSLRLVPDSLLQKLSRRLMLTLAVILPMLHFFR